MAASPDACKDAKLGVAEPPVVHRLADSGPRRRAVVLPSREPAHARASRSDAGAGLEQAEPGSAELDPLAALEPQGVGLVARQLGLQRLAVGPDQLDPGAGAKGQHALDRGGQAGRGFIGGDLQLVRAGIGLHLAAGAAAGAWQLVFADVQHAFMGAPDEAVGRAEEAVDKRRGRALVDLLRRADLLDAAVVHQHDAVGHLQRLVLVVGDEDAGDVQLVVQAAQPAAQLLAHLGIQRTEGFVQQQHARLHREGTGQRDALALAAGELWRETVGQPVELHELQQLDDALLDLGLGQALLARLDAQPERDVVEHRHVTEQRVMLEHEADLALAHMGVGRVLAVQQHPAAVGLLQAGDDAQQRGLAAARGAEQRDQLAAGEFQADVTEGGEVAEALVDVFDLDAHEASCAETAARHSTICLSTSVTSASSARMDATAKAAANWYSL
mmetsp:Transcript_1013/g.2513  ORF Transcript_1013/g.2513 Transcript_1013/m.2513 type:complete len:443 (-) Transcript_1013:3285-4613(-)